MTRLATEAVLVLLLLILSANDVSGESTVQGFITCVCSPNGKKVSPSAVFHIRRLLARVNAGLVNHSRPVGNRARAKVARKLLFECARNTTLDDCIQVDANLRGQYPHPLCTYDKITGRNLRYKDGVPDWKAAAPICRTQNRTVEGIIIRPFYQTTSPFHPVREGCVAVEHLLGYHLQHRNHLLRPVLCHKGFCATQNHALEVNGVITSIRAECESGRWKNCRMDSKLVNNLRIWKTSRARVNEHIVVLPYNVRVPFILTWIVQLVQELMNLIW